MSIDCPTRTDINYIVQFDSVGNSGGCQDSYTVMPPRNTSQPCPETFSTPTSLSVNGANEVVPLTEYDWPDQVCKLANVSITDHVMNM